MSKITEDYAYALSDDVLHSHDTESDSAVTIYTLSRQITMTVTNVSNTGTLRITFELKSGVGAVNAYGRIYRNGAAVGTERINNTTNYVAYTEDIAGWSSGDLIQLYTKNDVTGVNWKKNFRVLGNIGVTRKRIAFSNTAP